MALDVEALRTSYDLVLRRNPNFAATFFAVLFARSSRARALFVGTTPRGRQLALAHGLRAVIEHLHDGEWLDEVLRRMGAEHLAHGATTEIYGAAAEALLIVFMEAAGTEWTPRYAHAWADAFAELIDVMVEGAAEADTLVDFAISEPAPASAS